MNEHRATKKFKRQGRANNCQLYSNARTKNICRENIVLCPNFFVKRKILKLIQETIKRGDNRLQTLADSNSRSDFTSLAARVKRITAHNLPVVKHTLREGLATGGTLYIYKSE